MPRAGVRAGRRAEPGPLAPAERLSQLHQDAAAAEQHPPLHLRDLRLQPGLRVHREHGERGLGSRWGCSSPSAIGALQRGSRALGQVLAVLPAHSPVPLQNVQRFSLERDALGKVLLEDGKGRCPFDPEYRSTAVMVGKARRPGTLALSAASQLLGQAELGPGRHGLRRGSRAVPGGVCWVPAGASLWQTASSTPGLSATSRATSRPSTAARRAASPSRQRTPSTGCRVRTGAGMAGRGLHPPGWGRRGDRG